MKSDAAHALVSICIPTFNGAEFLSDTLQSIANQTYSRLEIVVSDDNSQDDTLRIVETFRERISHPIHVYHHEPQGIGSNWNNCLAMATGEYIKFVFQDDIIEPNCVQEMVDAFSIDEQIGLVASTREFIIDPRANQEDVSKWLVKFGDLQSAIESQGQNYLLLDKSFFRTRVFSNSPRNKVGEPSVTMFKKSIIRDVGLFDTDLVQALDYVYWYKILKVRKICILRKPLVKFRLHQNQATNKNRSIRIKDYDMFETMLFKDYFWLLNVRKQRDLLLSQTLPGRIISRLLRVVRS